MKGLELIGKDPVKRKLYEEEAGRNGVPIGRGEGYVPLFVDYLEEQDCSLLLEAFLASQREKPLLPSSPNARFPYGCDDKDFPFLRSGDLTPCTKEELSFLCGLGIREVFDFRDPSGKEELIHKLESVGIVYRNFYLKPGWPVFSKKEVSFDELVEASDKGYRHLIDQKETLEMIRNAYEKAQGKVVFSCSCGRDRTGVVSLLTEAFLGWDTRRMIVDYAISYFRLSHLLKGVSEAILGEHYGEIMSPVRFFLAFAVCGANKG